MSYSTFANIHAAPLVLRTPAKRDSFVYFTLLLCLALAIAGLALGAPDLGDGVLLVAGP
jgi:hypothetical protein